jgi:prepilin-type N-terminal cleavage/methylation domain-containing protein
MKDFLKISGRGVTLIELLIALVISSILIAGIYRMFIHQQRAYTTQEQVADMQQNVRGAINKMIREIRLAGFGGKNENTNGNSDIITVFGNVNGFANIINPVNDTTVDGITHDQITVIAAYSQLGILAASAFAGDTTLKITYSGSVKFNSDPKKYMCINGRNNYVVVPGEGSTLTLATPLKESHSSGEPVFLVEAITYELGMNKKGIPVLYRNPNTGGPKQPVAENIENLQFRYVLVDSTESDNPANPKDIRAVSVSITARTQMTDPQLKEGGGYRRRTINTYIDLRNLRDESS